MRYDRTPSQVRASETLWKAIVDCIDAGFDWRMLTAEIRSLWVEIHEDRSRDSKSEAESWKP